MELREIPVEDGGGFEVFGAGAVGYTYQSDISGYWAPFSIYGRQMAEFRFRTPLQAASYVG